MMMKDDGKRMDEVYTDIGATTSQAMEISMKSRKLISSLIGDDRPRGSDQAEVRHRHGRPEHCRNP